MLRYLFIFSVWNLIYRLPDAQIIGGNNASIFDFPYHVSVRKGKIHICGGSIIHESHILTAAHCLNGSLKFDLDVLAGSAKRNGDGQLLKVDKIILHTSHNPNIDKYDYDIAVLKLNKSLEFSNSVQEIRMASNTTHVLPNSVGETSGWGQTSNSPYILSEYLQSVALPYIPLENCREYYKKHRKLTERMFCAGNIAGGKDTCGGDSGGGYVVNGILMGITSWGGICGAPNQPAVFTNIMVLRDFVDNILNNKTVS